MQCKFGKGNDGNKTLPRGQGSSSISGGSVDPLAARPGRIREEHPSSTDHSTKARQKNQRSWDPLASVIGAEPVRRKSYVQRAIIAKFDNCLTSEDAKSSRCPDHIRDSEDIIESLLRYFPRSLFLFLFFVFNSDYVRTLFLVVFLTFSDNVAAWCYSLHMDDEVARLVTDFKKWKDAEKVAVEKAKKA